MIPADERRPLQLRQGYAVLYHHGEINRCPACSASSWLVGRTSAECACCGAAIPFTSPPPPTQLEGQN